MSLNYRHFVPTIEANKVRKEYRSRLKEKKKKRKDIFA